MIRFANALGYRGFSDMQQVFRGHLVERSTSYRERIDQLRRKQLNGQRAPAGVLHQLVGDCVAELGHLEESIREADVKAAVKLIAGADRIHVLAQRRAFPVASYLAYALGQLELKTHLLDGAGGMLKQNLRAIDNRDVLLVASFRSYSPEVVEAANSCSDRGVPVIAITDGPLSPLVPLGQGVLRAGRRFVQAVPLPGGAAVPGAGAGDEHRPPPGRKTRAQERAQGQGMKHRSIHRPLDLICLGRAAVDLYGEQIGGRLEDMQTFSKYLGGSPANTAVGLARLGLKPAMLTRVGDEHNGRFVRETLAAEGVDVSHVKTDPQRLTALVFLGIQDRETFPLVFYRDNCADMAVEPGRLRQRFHRFGHWPAGIGHAPVATPDLQDLPPRDGRWPGRWARAWCWTSTIARCSGA